MMFLKILSWFCGIIVRTIVRLCEHLCEMKNVFRVIGGYQVQNMAQEGRYLCEKDFIFAPSLYIT